MKLKSVAIREEDYQYVKYLTERFRYDEPGQTYGDTISYIIHHFRNPQAVREVEWVVAA